MIEESTDSRSGYKRINDEVLVMEVSKSGVRRSRDCEVTNSGAGNGKRKKFSSQINAYDQSRRDDDDDVNFQENVVLTTVSASATSDHHASSFLCFRKDYFRPDLKAECISETEAFMSNSFSGETSVSSVICLESEEMESVSTSTSKNKKNPAPANEATSRRKPSPATAAKSPSPAELEEFFSKAEKYEEKRFADKYNYDIVKDAPMEGRYQWVRLKPQ